MTDVTAKPMTLTAYAKRRGVSAMAVSRAVSKGKLRACVVWGPPDAKGKAHPKGISDPDLADREWEANSDYTDAPQRAAEATAAAVAARNAAREEAARPKQTPPPGGWLRPQDSLSYEDTDPDEPKPVAEMNLHDAALHEKKWKAKTAELNYRREAGELVEASKVTAAVEDAFVRVKTRLLALPSRAKQKLPHLTVADLAEVDRLIREALEELAEVKP